MFAMVYLCSRAPCQSSSSANETLSTSSCDDGTLVTTTYELAGQAFLSLLARFEREGLLANKESPPVENLGLIMALYISPFYVSLAPNTCPTRKNNWTHLQ